MPNVVSVYVRILEKAASNQANLEQFHSGDRSVMERPVFSGGFERGLVGVVLLDSLASSQCSVDRDHLCPVVSATHFRGKF